MDKFGVVLFRLKNEELEIQVVEEDLPTALEADVLTVKYFDVIPKNQIAYSIRYDKEKLLGKA